MKPFIELANVVKEDPELSAAFYPLVLLSGSRIKGYSGITSDFGSAIFVRPEVAFDEREHLLQTLEEKLPDVPGIRKIKEFWLKQTDDGLTFRSVPDTRTKIVGAPQVHFLLGGVWVGEKKEYEHISTEILKKYVNLERFGEQKDLMRSHLLRQMEFDMLQYRLLHKGYSRLYPTARDDKYLQLNTIDGESDFWDPGYRRIATQLFLSRVFLPDLS